VPFKQDLGRGSADPGGGGERPAPERPGSAPPATTAVDGVSLPAGARQASVEGAPVAVGPQGGGAAGPLADPAAELRALLAIDLDGDGDRDALLVVGRAGAALEPAAPAPSGAPPNGRAAATLAVATREGARFAAPRVVAPLPIGPRCEVAAASVRAVARALAAVTIDPRCAAPEAPAPGDPPAPAPPALTPAPATTWVVALGPEPRVRESFGVAPAEGRTAGDLALGFRAEDRDADGAEDVIVEVSLRTAELPNGVKTELPWLDRPGGLARDTREPEAQWLAVAQRAKAALRRTPDAALADARAVLASHAAICREGGAPRLVVGGAEGVVCRASAAVGLAATVATQALARRGDVLGALEAWAALDGPGRTVARADRDAARRALEAMAAEPGTTLRIGPTHRYRGGPDVRLPAATFLADGSGLLLRGGSPSRWLEATGEILPWTPGGGGVGGGAGGAGGAGSEAAGGGGGGDGDAAGDDGTRGDDGPRAGVAERGDSGDVLVRDPSGRFVVVDVHRTCAGYALGVAAAANVVEGVLVGRYHAEPLVAAAPPPPGARCGPGDAERGARAIPESARFDAGGHLVLGWAPQGVVVARGGAVRVVPLDEEARPAGDAAELPAGTPAPAPLPSGAATPDGQLYAVATPFGVLVHDVVARRASLLRPQGWAAAAGDATDAALSPDGRRVAVVKGDKVLVIQRAR
jgi:hypothetical protein